MRAGATPPGVPHAETAAPAGFHGFGPGATAFLAALAGNNTRDWFTAHRDTYEREVLAPLRALVRALSFAFEAHGIALAGDPKRSLFRIHRDVRFSRDKTPYKTNASFVMSRDGGKAGAGILYFQFGGAGPFLALGFHAPEPDDLAALRHQIARAPAEWAKAEAALAANGLSLSREDALVRLPKGFEAFAGSALAEVLRLKSFVVRQDLPERAILGPGLVDEVVSFAARGQALLAFGRRAIESKPKPPC